MVAPPKPAARTVALARPATPRQPHQNVDANALLRALVFGRSGSGKSHLLTTVQDVPELLPALIISCDGGEQTLSRRVTHPDVHVARALSPEQINTAVNAALNGEYKFVGLDGLKSIYDTLMDFIEPPLLQTTLLPSSMDEWKDSTQRDRGIALQMVMRIMYWLTRRCSAHVMVTCLAGDVLDEKGNTTGEMSLAIPGQLKRLVPGEFAMTGYYELSTFRQVVEGKVRETSARVLRINPAKKWPEAKSRYADAGTVPDITEPTVSKLVQHMKGVQ